MVMAVDRVQVAGEPNAHLMAGARYLQRRVPVVGLWVPACAPGRAERLERPRHWPGGLHTDALVEHLLAAAPHFDAGAGGAIHDVYALDDVACLRADIGSGDEEVVGETMHGDPEVRLSAVNPGLPDGQTAGTHQRLITDVVGNRESGAVDDGVCGVVDAIDGVDARRGQGVD